MRITAMIGLIMAVGLAAMQPQTLTAQNEQPEEQSTPQREQRGPLPAHFGRLGMSSEQKEKLYAIQESYEVKIAELRKQIVQLEAERDRTLETLLTPGQKLRLQELREEARVKQEQAARAANSTGEVESRP